MKEALKLTFFNNRMKSFYWRTGMMVLAVIINQILVLITATGMTTPITVILGLILGEISKFINQTLSTPTA